MSKERTDIVLRPAGENDSPDLLKSLVEAVNDLIPAAADGGGKWMRGKGEQEMAKAAEIRANVMARIGELQLERERLIQQRDAAEEAAKQARTGARNEHKQRMYNLETKRIQAQADALRKAVAAIRDLREMGVEIRIEHIQALLPALK